MNILEQIIAHKKQEVTSRKELFPVKLLEKSIYFNTPPVSFSRYLLQKDKSGVIAEFKRRSPSKGVINAHASVERVSIGYIQAGASALSILTDEHFFGGKNTDLTEARRFNFCPILRKDFVVEEYQILEARSIGADAILLIAECLDKTRVEELAKTAKDLGLEVLLELHSPAQLDKLNPYIDAVGVNNRNLEDFKVDVGISFELASRIPDNFVKVSESGLDDPAVVVELKRAGFNGFLIGEYFMKASFPEQQCAEFIRRVKTLEELYDSATTRF